MNQAISTSDKSENGSDHYPIGLRLAVVVMVPILAILLTGLVLWGISALKMGLANDWSCPIFYALLITVVGAGAGSVALGLTWRFWPSYLAQGILAAIGLRLFVTLGGIVIFVLLMPKPELKFFVCVVGFYTVGLVSEMIVAIKITMVRSKI